VVYLTALSVAQTILWNVGLLRQDYAALYPSKPLFSYSRPWEPEMSQSLYWIINAYKILKDVEGSGRGLNRCDLPGRTHENKEKSQSILLVPGIILETRTSRIRNNSVDHSTATFITTSVVKSNYELRQNSLNSLRLTLQGSLDKLLARYKLHAARLGFRITQDMRP
jgi:hypothetical protein